MRKCIVFSFLLVFFIACRKEEKISSPSLMVSTFAGDGNAAYLNGIGTGARFANPKDIAIDKQGNLYVCDAGNNIVRKISPAGVVSTFAGSGTPGHVDGPAATAQFSQLVNIALDRNGNIYVLDLSDSTYIRKITPNGDVSTVASFDSSPVIFGICIDSQGNIYLGAPIKIIKITPAGVKSVFCGSFSDGYNDGVAGSAQFRLIECLAIDAQDNLFVGDEGNARIRKVTPAGVVSTFCGSGFTGYKNGPTNQAEFDLIRGITIDSHNNVYVSDQGNHCVRKITPDGVSSLYAGTIVKGGTLGTLEVGKPGFADGNAKEAMFNVPKGLAVDQQGNIYVADFLNSRIRKIGY
jgi:sugar lactone lactonase YvrE